MKILVLFFGCIVYMLGALSRVAVPGMAFEQIIADYGFTSAQIAMLPSIGVLGCMAFIGIGGIAVDKLGWMRMLLLGALLQSVAYIPVHESASLAAMLTGEFFNGGGRTIVYLSILKIFDVSFDRKYFAALIGVFYVFSYGGTLGASAVFPFLVAHCGSWQLAARAVNYGTLASALLIVLGLAFLRERQTSGPTAVRQVFPWRDMVSSFKSTGARDAIIVTALNIAIYWSFLCVSAGPYARSLGQGQLISLTNGLVMTGMVFMGSVSLLFRNARRPFFLWAAFATCGAFAALLLGFPRVGYILLGTGYGVTSVLLAGVKERVPAVFMASSIGFTNFLANIIQVASNQASGYLMATGESGYTAIFTLYLVLALIALGFATRLCRSRETRGASFG